MRKTRIFSVAVFVIAVVLSQWVQYRQRTVTDTVPPTINMADSAVTISTQDGVDGVLAGVTAEDQRDGDVTNSLIVERLSDFVAEGICEATIAAFDSAGNVTKVTRQVVYSDYVSPRFQMTAPLRFPQGSQEVLYGVTAYDVLDGDLSEQVKISAETDLSMVDAGEYSLEYSVTNSGGDVSKLKATVTLYDPAEEAACPQIRLTDYLVYLKTGEQLNPWDYITEIDVGSRKFEKTSSGVLRCAQGEEADTISSDDVSISNPVDEHTPDTYEIKYSYTSNGNEGSVRLIVVVED